MPTTTLSPRTTTARSTTIALKLLMAVTGLVFVGYLLLHMYGNLKALSGEESFNGYAEHLRTFGEPMLPYGGLLWIVRLVLLLSIVGHVYAAFALWSRAGSARRTKYAAMKTAATTKWMRWGGVFLLLFIVWHLIHFTIVKVSPNADKQGIDVTANPYQLVVASFEVWWMTLIYVAAMVALFMHLMHGVFSAQQTLGWTSTPKARTRARGLGVGLAALIVVGFLIPPLSIAFGLID
ncbi:succinate dehydrogenase cytochrome b subunit [Knoellia aerolata]|uniref:Succinate dehydrogenase n=1 Tax=Knoellia aerolata DSM 18566 TaxID=1385519 RepID=A0A0A0JZ86_9MICO|nr:succinate dehydrogenase cytochrome b subunit [Knoellia aerolata]KGN41999.1 succinate dehydrogenase [Knoellia aerolata DSM 18566]